MTKILNLNIRIRVIPARRQVLLICEINDKTKNLRFWGVGIFFLKFNQEKQGQHDNY